MGMDLGLLTQKTRNHTRIPSDFRLSPSRDRSADPPHPYRYMYCADYGHKQKVNISCGDRTCVTCLEKQYRRRYKSYISRIKQKLPEDPEPGHGFKFLTLTTRNVHSTDVIELRKEVRRIQASFEKLRRWKAYKKRVLGGFRGVELKHIPGRGWNIHLHIMYFGAFLLVCCKPMKDANSLMEIEHMERSVCPKCKEAVCIRRDWLKVTGGDPIVDIKRMWHLRGALKYILLYVTKAPDVRGFEYEYNEIVKGTRLIQPFGIFFKADIVIKRFSCPECGCEFWVIDIKLFIYRLTAATPVRSPPECEKILNVPYEGLYTWTQKHSSSAGSIIRPDQPGLFDTALT